MDQEELEILQEEPQEETPAYEPRPAWQVWAARIGLLLFILILIAYYWNLFQGGR